MGSGKFCGVSIIFYLFIFLFLTLVCEVESAENIAAADCAFPLSAHTFFMKCRSMDLADCACEPVPQRNGIYGVR